MRKNGSFFLEKISQVLNHKVYKNTPILTVFFILFSINLALLASFIPLSQQASSNGDNVTHITIEIPSESIERVNFTDSGYLTLVPGLDLHTDLNSSSSNLNSYNYSIIFVSIFDNKTYANLHTLANEYQNESSTLIIFTKSSIDSQTSLSSQNYIEYYLYIVNNSNTNISVSVQYYYSGVNFYVLLIALLFFLLGIGWLVFSTAINKRIDQLNADKRLSNFFLVYNKLILPVKPLILWFFVLFNNFNLLPNPFGSELAPSALSIPINCYASVFSFVYYYSNQIKILKIDFLIQFLYSSFGQAMILFLLFFLPFVVPVLVRFFLQKKNSEFFTLFPISWKLYLSVILVILVTLFLFPLITDIFAISIYNFLFLGVQFELAPMISFTLDIAIFTVSYILLITLLSIIPKNVVIGLILPIILIIYLALENLTARVISPYYYFLYYKSQAICLNSSDINLIKNTPIILFIISLVAIITLFYGQNKFQNITE